MTLNELKELHQLQETSTGGNCRALSKEYKGNEILIADEYSIPDSDSTDITIVVFSKEELGEPYIVVENLRFNELDTALRVLYKTLILQ